MAVNLRELVESDLATTLEGDFGLPVELIDPDGTKYDGLFGQVLHDTTSVDMETVEQVTTDNPIVTLRRSSLTRIPLNGENWTVRIPTTPSLTAPMGDFMISRNHSLGGGGSIGYIKLYLQRIGQS